MSDSSTTNKVVIITDPYFPDEVAAGYFITRIAEGLAETRKVVVLCGQPNYRLRGTRAPTREALNSVDIHRLRSTTFSNDNIPLRLINIATFALYLAFKSVAILRKGDLVIVVTTPPALPFVARFACTLRRAKCLLLVHDVFPEALSAVGLTAPTAFVSTVLSKIVRTLYRGMDAIVVIGRDMHKLVSHKRGACKHPLIIIPNWADTGEIIPTDRRNNPLLARLGLLDKFVVQYSGNMGRTHNLEATLNAAEILRSDPSIHFLLIGGGKKKRMVEEVVLEKDLVNVTLLDYQRRADLCVSLNACDLAIIPFVSSMSGVSVPSRMYNVMASGKPILAVTEADSELAMVVAEDRIGWVVSPDQSRNIADIILRGKENQELLREMGVRARKVAETRYTLHSVIHQFDELIREIT